MFDYWLSSGTDIYFWFFIVKLTIILLTIVFLARKIKSIFRIVFFIAALAFTFVYGPGERAYNPSNDEKQGMMKLQEEFDRSDTTTLESIRKKTEEKIPDVLKSQSDSNAYKREKQKADEEIENLLKKWEK